MGKEAQIAIKINQIKNMKANKINKSIVLDFDNQNSINNLANSTRLMYLVLLRFLLIYYERKKK